MDSSDSLEDAEARFRAGDFAQARRILQKAQADHPFDLRISLSLGRLSLAEGDVDQAETHLRDAAGHAPDDVDRLELLADVQVARRVFNDAIDLYRRVCDHEPARWSAIRGLAGSLAEAGQLGQAIERYRDALYHAPTNPDLWMELGLAFFAAGDSQSALEHVDEALRLKPDHAPSLANRGVVLRAQGRLDEAVMSYQRALELDSTLVGARRNLGRTLVSLRRFPEALTLFEQARGSSDDPDLACDLAAAYRDLGHDATAERIYRETIVAHPAAARPRAQLASLLAEIDAVDEAREQFRFLASAGSTDARRWEFVADACLAPLVPSSNAEIDLIRRGLDRGLDRHAEGPIAKSLAALAAARAIPPFALDHYGTDDRAWRERFASVVGRSAPRRDNPMSRGRPRVGFLVTEGHESVFLRSFGGLISRLPATDYDVVVFAAPAGVARLRAAKTPCSLEPLPDRFDDAAERIRDARLDVLCHWEVGTDGWNYYLPMMALAPLQITSFGLQSTTGQPAIAEYVSSDWLEPPNASDHYRERLIRLPTLPAYLPRPAMEPEEPMPREALDLPVDRAWLVCPQRLAKVHPDFDIILCEMLRRAENAIVVFTAGRSPVLVDRLRHRWKSRIPDVVERIHVLPEARGERYGALLRRADVILDTIHYGGVNTTYDALARGKVVITMPGQFQRGRYAAGCYRAMGLLDLVCPTDRTYVDAAIRTATDADYRREQERRIAERRDVLFEDSALVVAWDAYLSEAISRVREKRSP